MELLTVQETARLLRVSPITVRRYITSGRLTAVRVGRGVRVHREVAERFVTPVEPRAIEPTERPPRGRPFTMEDPLWDIVGIGRSDGPSDVADNKHKYLADAYLSDKG